MNRRGAIVVAVLACLVGPAAPASAQDYPPPVMAVSCFVVKGEVGDGFVVGRAEFRGDVRAEGTKGCAAPFGEVDVSVDDAVLASTTAAEDGSFLAAFSLPASVQPGRHTVTGAIEGRGQVDRSLDVIGATVLGISETRTGGAADGRGGTLPRSGGEILLLILWAVALIALGTILVTAARRKAWLFAPARAPAARRDDGGPPSDVPFVDTSRFVPRYPAHPRAHEDDAGGATLIEWNARRSERRA